MEGLTDKQKRFCEEYMIDLNATQASIRAGYSKKTANVIASENLTKKGIKEYIKFLKDKLSKEIKDSNLIPINKELFDSLIENFTDVKEFRDWVSYVVQKESIIEGFNFGKIKRKPLDSITRYSVLERAGFKCQACGSKPSANNDVTLEIDHITPISLGGKEIASNFQVLCKLCNISKSNNHNFNHNTDDYFNLQ